MLQESSAPVHYGRRAFGPGKKRSAAAKALHVAESMLQRDLEGDPWTWQGSYGIDPHSPYGQLVNALLIAKRQQEGVSWS